MFRKPDNLIVGFSLAVLTALTAHGQDAFQNLNFELGNPGTPYGQPNGGIPVANALPYWSVYYGSVQQSVISYGVVALGSTQVTLQGGPTFSAIDGNYSVLFQTNPEGASSSITQTGLIPVGSHSLFFEADLINGGLFELLVGNQILPYAAVGSGSNYTLYAADISAWAGDKEQITFLAPPVQYDYNGALLDDISFSPSPEPGVVALTALGVLLLGATRRFGPP
jgi:hypothetical protein